MVEFIPVSSNPLIPYYFPYSKNKLKALGDNTRLQILELLSKNPQSIGELQTSLERHGHKKSVNTIRHHVDVLKKVGLVSLVGLKEGQGGTLKYYGSSSRLLDHDVTINDLDSFHDLIDIISPELDQLVKSFLNNNKTEIMTLVNQLRPCEKCDAQHFVEFIISHVIMSSLGNVIDNLPSKDFQYERNS